MKDEKERKDKDEMEWNVGPFPIFPFRHDPQFPPFERFLQRLPKFQRLRLSDLLYLVSFQPSSANFSEEL